MEQGGEGGESVLPWHGGEQAGRGGDDGGDGEGEEEQVKEGVEHREGGLCGREDGRKQTLLCLSVTSRLSAYAAPFLYCHDKFPAKTVQNIYLRI